MKRRTFMNCCLAGGISAASRDAAAGTVPPELQKRKEAWLDLLGPFPETAPPLDAEVTPRGELEPGLQCFHVRFRTEPEDWVTAYLLFRNTEDNAPRPAVLCPHSTTRGAGKDRIAGLTGAAPGDPPDPPETSRAYGLELARWGYVVLCPDLPCDGERIPPGFGHYDTRPFYERHPEWSIMGKIAWDMMRCVDFLETRPEVDPSRIACLGHSLGGQTSLFAAAFEPRIAAAVTNGGMTSWARDTDHWARPPDPQGRPVYSWIYIPRFRPYIEDPALPIPADFEHLKMMVAPRPLLVMSSEDEMTKHDTVNKVAVTAEHYRALGAGDRIGLFSYPGGHNYPPTAKRFSFAWLDRWMNHTPAVPTIWPGWCG